MKTASKPYPLWIYGIAALTALTAVFVTYGPALDGPFLLDDSYLPYLQPQFATAPLTAWMRGVRPLTMLTYWINFQTSGEATGSYHLFNVVLHLLSGILIYLCIRKIWMWANLDAGKAPLWAAFAAGVFLLHPLQTEAVSYVASRSETLSVFFFLSGFTVFLYQVKPSHDREGAISFTTAAIILLLFGAACVSKEHAVVLPALLLLTDYYWNPGFAFAGIRQNWRVYVPIALAGVLGAAYVLKVLSTATSAGFALQDLTWYQYFFTECRAFWHYVLLYLFPLGQNIDHDFPISHTVSEHGAILGLIALLALVGAAWHWRRTFPLESYGLFTLLLLLAPTSSFIPIRDTLVERRMYLPFIGLLLITVGLLRRLKTRFAIADSSLRAGLGVVLVSLALLTFQRNQLWGNAVGIWRDSVTKSPAKFRPRFQLAYAYYNAGQCNEAATEFGQAAQLDLGRKSDAKPDYSLLVDWALAYDCAGNTSAAIGKLTEAAAIEKSAHVYSQLGMMYAKQAQYPQALDALETAAGLDPNFGMTYVYRGNVYTLQGNKARAAEEYRHALAINPQDGAARDGLNRISR
ncbi:MAG: tetratricopeptide repeat protein [Acidobacteriota bacterium]|nr:tetratricopeptide repeat protein [Acidobacteriota bacterium]